MENRCPEVSKGHLSCDITKRYQKRRDRDSTNSKKVGNFTTLEIQAISFISNLHMCLCVMHAYYGCYSNDVTCLYWYSYLCISFCMLASLGGIREVQPDKRPRVYIMGEPDLRNFGAIHESASLDLIWFGLDGHGWAPVSWGGGISWAGPLGLTMPWAGYTCMDPEIWKKETPEIIFISC